MSKSAIISARIDPELKHSVEDIFSQLGLTTAQAITLFLKQVEQHQGLPFAVRIYNSETLSALAESENRADLEAFNSLDELFESLEM